MDEHITYNDDAEAVNERKDVCSWGSGIKGIQSGRRSLTAHMRIEKIELRTITSREMRHYASELSGLIGYHPRGRDDIWFYPDSGSIADGFLALQTLGTLGSIATDRFSELLLKKIHREHAEGLSHTLEQSIRLGLVTRIVLNSSTGEEEGRQV